MGKRKYISYLRVSTAKQGASGLGLEAQREAVTKYIGDGHLVAEFVEVESGKRNDRPALADALRACRGHRAVLVVAKLDRLARNVAFVSALMEKKVEFVVCDFPEANKLTIHILAAVAEYEAQMISNRTKGALRAAKARGVILGGERGGVKIAVHAVAANGVSAEVRGGKAQRAADDILPIIDTIRAEGVVSLAGIAARLTEQHVPTSRDRNREAHQGHQGRQAAWSAVQVQRVLARVTTA